MKIELEYQTGYQVAQRLYTLVSDIDVDERYTWLEPTCQDMDTQLAEKITKMQTILDEHTQSALRGLALYRPLTQTVEVTVDSLSAADYVVENVTTSYVAARVSVNLADAPEGLGVIAATVTDIGGVTSLTFFNATASPITATFDVVLTLFPPTAGSANTDRAQTYIETFAPASAGECEDFKILNP